MPMWLSHLARAHAELSRYDAAHGLLGSCPHERRRRHNTSTLGVNPTLHTTARGQPPAELGLRQTRSNGKRQECGATS